MPATFVNGKTFKPSGKTKSKVLIGSQQFELDFLVVENFPYNVLLGLNFCEVSNACIDWRVNKILVGDDSFDLPRHFIEEPQQSARCAQRAVVPKQRKAK